MLHEFLADLDRIFHHFASHRAEAVPDTWNDAVADDYFRRYLAALAARQTALHGLLARTAPLVYGLNELEG